MKKFEPIHLFLIFMAFILIARMFEGKIQLLYYAFVIIGFVFCFLAARKYFRK